MAKQTVTKEEFKVGDGVVVLKDHNKHTARSRFRVTGKEKEQIQVQKNPHPWKKHKNLRNKVYNTEEKRLLKVENQERQENWQKHSIPTNKYDSVN